MAWDGKIVNNNVYAKGQTVNIRQLPSTASKILATVKAGIVAGRTTGATSQANDGIWLQLISPDNKTYGYARSDVVTLKPANQDISIDQAKGLVDQMINNDLELQKSLIRSAVLIDALKSQGLDTSQYEKVFQQVTNSFNNRQNKIKNSKLLQYKTGVQKGYDSLLAEVKTSLENLKPENMVLGIGAIPILAIVIAVLVGAGLATAAYFAFKPDYDQGAKDLKVTRELELALSKVDPATAQKIKDQLGNQIDKAYNAGKSSQWATDVMKIGKWVLIGTLGFLGFSLVINRKSNEKKKGNHKPV